MRIVFMGSPAEVLRPLEILLAEQGQKNFELVAVVSQPARPAGRKRVLTDPPVAEFAKNSGLKVLQPEKASDPEFLAELRAIRPDVIITAAYGQMLSDEFLKVPKRAVINIHPSLLPEYRGATPVQAALLDGKTTSGVTVLFTVKKMDAGAIIEQQSYEISPTEKAADLLLTLFEIGGKLSLSAIEKLRDPDYKGIEQDPNKVTFCRKFSKNDGAVDFNSTAEQLCHQFRAFYPWPGSYSFCAEERVVFDDLSFSQEDAGPEAVIGSFSLVDSALKVVCTRGHLLIRQLTPAGSKSMPAQNYYDRIKAKGWPCQFSSEAK